KLLEKEEKKFEEKDTGSLELMLKAVKGIPHSLWGFNCGVCTAGDIKLWAKKDFFLLEIVDTETKKVSGYVELYKKGSDLYVPGIEPSRELLNKADAEKVFNIILEALNEIKKTGKYDNIYIPTDPMIHSNRQEIQKLINKQNFKEKTLKEQVNWNTEPKPYPFSEVYILEEKASAQDIIKGLKSLIAQITKTLKQNVIKTTISELTKRAMELFRMADFRKKVTGLIENSTRKSNAPKENLLISKKILTAV
ncbi:hypothetical protein ACFL4S_01765, partial [bacterium]